MNDKNSKNATAKGGVKDQVDGFLKSRESVVRTLLTVVFACFVAWALLQYIGIVKDGNSALFNNVFLSKNISDNEKPRALAIPGATELSSPSSQAKVFLSNEMGIKFAYPANYTETAEATDEGMAMFRSDNDEDVIAVVRHVVPDTVSIDEFIAEHKEQQLVGCVDVIDCIDSENFELITVGNMPAIIYSPSEYIAYIRAEGAVFEMISTESKQLLEEVLNSIVFLGL
jgi:hypothetical protein